MQQPPTVGDVLAVLHDHAPELAAHVHAFLMGGRVGALPIGNDWGAAFQKLRRLTDFTHNAVLANASAERVAILATALRLQSVVLYETIRRNYNGG